MVSKQVKIAASILDNILTAWMWLVAVIVSHNMGLLNLESYSNTSALIGGFCFFAGVKALCKLVKKSTDEGEEI